MGIKLAALGLSIGLLSGCAFTVHDVQVNYDYVGTVSTDLSNINPSPLKIGVINDGRNVENPRLIMNMTNLNGATTSGGWQAEKPLAEIVRDAIIQGLINAKTPLADSGESLILTGELVDFDYEVIMGMWTGTIKSSLSVKLQVRNTNTNKIIWKDTIISSASVKSGEGAKGALKAVLDDLIADLLSDEYFVQQLRG